MRSPSPFAVVAAAVLLGAAPSARGAPPEEPLVLTDIPEIGQPGGSLRMLVGRTRDTRLFTVYGHARLVGYAPDLAFVPDILASFTVEEGRIFTFRLRRGHRWSDGAPFTTEDFRFWWEDVALDTELSPLGPPVEMLVDGEPPRVEVLDPLTIRYVWSKPNPLFLPALARATPLFIYAPAHYLKRFHRRYADPAALQRLVSQDRARDWVQLFGRRERMYESDNPDLPTLEPWMPTIRPPAQRFVAIRNPFFHRVDERGQQLPYIDRFVLELVDGKLIAMKTAAGETDLQGRGLSFRDYTFLKESEGRSGLEVRLWKEGRGAHLALYPNLNAADPVWRGLFRDRRFRLALSLAIDREMLAQYLYFGLATPANNTILPESPLWSDEVGTACLGHDPAQANALLDALGLDRGQDGVRRLPDGRPLELVIETPGEEPEQLDVIELLADDFAAIGLRIHGRPSERELLRNRLFAGQALMTIWYGIENGLPRPETSPHEFVPTSQFDQPQWPKWGQHFETRGAAGEAVDLPEARRLLDLFAAWRNAASPAEQEAIWRDILVTYAEQCWTIGLVRDVLQPIAVRRGLHNVPQQAVWSWEPHAQFGIYRPDTFFYRN
ncbi:Periplasmic oligopeptide-binding protein [bacterium HR40]|nr:Periplasmic oligopeptide-binding protein [bacterium HR40]